MDECIEKVMVRTALDCIISGKTSKSEEGKKLIKILGVEEKGTKKEQFKKIGVKYDETDIRIVNESLSGLISKEKLDEIQKILEGTENLEILWKYNNNCVNMLVEEVMTKYKENNYAISDCIDGHTTDAKIEDIKDGNDNSDNVMKYLKKEDLDLCKNNFLNFYNLYKKSDFLCKKMAKFNSRVKKVNDRKANKRLEILDTLRKIKDYDFEKLNVNQLKSVLEYVDGYIYSNRTQGVDKVGDFAKVLSVSHQCIEVEETKKEKINMPQEAKKTKGSKGNNYVNAQSESDATNNSQAENNTKQEDEEKGKANETQAVKKSQNSKENNLKNAQVKSNIENNNQVINNEKKKEAIQETQLKPDIQKNNITENINSKEKKSLFKRVSDWFKNKFNKKQKSLPEGEEEATSKKAEEEKKEENRKKAEKKKKEQDKEKPEEKKKEQDRENADEKKKEQDEEKPKKEEPQIENQYKNIENELIELSRKMAEDYKNHDYKSEEANRAEYEKILSKLCDLKMKNSGKELSKAQIMLEKRQIDFICTNLVFDMRDIISNNIDDEKLKNEKLEQSLKEIRKYCEEDRKPLSDREKFLKSLNTMKIDPSSLNKSAKEEKFPSNKYSEERDDR